MKKISSLTAAGALLVSYSAFGQDPGAPPEASLPALTAKSFGSSVLASLPEFNGTMTGSGLSLYGSVDVGVNYQTVGGRSVWQTESGGEWTSKFGMFGREDLGSGVKAEFNLESGFLVNNGNLQASQTLFNREAWVGLTSPQFGQVRMGNQINAGLPLFLDPFGSVGTNSVVTWLATAEVQTKSGVSANADLGPGAAQIAPRVANALTWVTPRIAGFGAELLYAFNNTAGASPRASNQGALLSWSHGPWYLVGSYNQVWSNPVAINEGGPETSIRNDIYSAGALYDCGRFVVSASINQSSPRLADDGIARVYTLGGILPFGRNVLRASLVYRNTSGVRDSTGALANDSAVGMMFGYDYNLSKRTALYARAGFIRNYGISTVLLNNNPLPTEGAGGAPETGLTPVTMSVGMYHNF